MAFNLTAGNPVAHRVRVYYEGSSTIQEGMPLCYNQDTTTNWFGGSVTQTQGDSCGQVSATTTTAEGSQNEGKYIRVEDAATANLHWFAGVVAKGGWVGTAGPKALDIFVPNGAIVPVRAYKNCSIGDTLGIGDGLTYFAAVTGDGDPLPVALAMETVNRASVAGLCLAKIFPTGQQIVATGAYFAPVRSSSTQGREYGVQINGDDFFTGTAGAQSYLLELTGDLPATADKTGDSYSAYLHISGSNYAQNDTNYTYRGLNCAISNRSAGTLGQMYGGNISISLKSGSGNLTEALALQVDAQDLTAGTKTKFGGIDVAINREGTAATEEFGMRLRTRGTINTAVNTVFRVDKDATDHGFVNLFNIESDAVDYAACTGDVTVDANDKVIPIVLGGSTFYLIAVDSIPAG